jgi:hypothetical protein
MKKTTREPNGVPRDTTDKQRGAHDPEIGDAPAPDAVVSINDHSVHSHDVHPSGTTNSSIADGQKKAAARTPSRGLAATISTTQLKQRIWLRALLTADRFRVIRTIDLAVCCFSERPYKAALTAAQRAIRGMVKAELLKRYRTDRFQTVYGLTLAGVDWLGEAGLDASSSVRRVSDMTNPEHRLWAQFWVLCCEARGLKALTEQELLHELSKSLKPGQPVIQGLLTVTATRGKRASTIQLRPDAVANESDGTTWLEVDRSKRGSDREASLAALVSSVGRELKDGSALRRVVIFCKTERILKRATAVLNGLALANNSEVLIAGRRHFREVEPGTYAVWAALESKLKDGRTQLVDTLVGHVIIQLLPIWLPKVRIDATNTHSLAGWFGENYLPYKRPDSLGRWKMAVSPLAALHVVAALDVAHSAAP